jgi:predicted ATPase
MVSVVAHALGVREQHGRPFSEAIVSLLKRKHALLIFDNCEHVLETSAELADEILHACPHIRVLATSRQALGIIGEVAHRVRSLALPEETPSLKADRAIRYGAIALFVDRALASDTRFTLTNDNAPIVAEICRRVDGIPLAIELAATRVNVVSVHSLARSLDDRFRVLTAGSRTALPRHQTLSALIDWSYDLLSPQEQKLFGRLSMFAGSFDLQASEAVCSGGGLDADSIADLLIALVEKSLVVAQTAETHERYRLLESTRAYALDKLNKSGRREAVARLHAEYFRDLAHSADDRFGVGSTAAWLASMELDLENYRTLLEWSLAKGNDPVLGGDVAGHLERLWVLTGLSGEARRWLDLALDRVSETDHPAVAARLWRAKARFLQGQPMRDCRQRALSLYEKIGDERGVSYTLLTLGYSLLQVVNLGEADEVIDRAIEAVHRHNDSVLVASCLMLEGMRAHHLRDYTTGRTFYSQALAAYRALSDEAAVATVMGNLAELEFADGQPRQALQLVNESLVIRSRGKERTDLTIDLNNSTAYRIALGELDEARESVQQALRLAQAEQNSWNTSVALQHLALLAALRGNVRLGAMLVGYVNKQFDDLGLQRETTEQWGYERLTAALRERLGDMDMRTLGQQGAAWSEDEAVLESVNN